MTQSRKASIAGLVVYVLSAYCRAGTPSVPIACAPEVAPSAITVLGGEGWVGLAPYPMQLYSAYISAGPPSSFAELRGEDLPKQRGVASTLYDFGGLATEQGIWLICSYGKAAEIELGRRLPDDFTRCTISRHQAKHEEPRRIVIECRAGK